MGPRRGAIPNELERHYVRRAVVHSIVPLAVLEAVRNLDTPVEDGLSEFAEELLSKRLGLSATVAMQLREYEGMVRRDAPADSSHVEALLRLVGRRPDADLVFADAGRRAARRAVRRLFVLTRLAARAGPRALGYVAARRAARAVFAGELRRESHVPIARVAGRSARSATRLMPLLDGFDLPALARELGALGADGWLLYDFRKVNPIAGRILGDAGMGTRRLFVLLPRAGRPVAVAHRIELQALADFPGDVRPYGAWRELHGHLEALVRGRTLAIETSPRDQVPYLDRVPHGVVQLLESLGARLVSSAPLVSRFAARWSAAELAGHRKAAEILAGVARDALAWVGSEAARGAEVRETGVQRRMLEAMERAGLWTNDGPIVAFGPTSAMPHYEPHPGADRRLAPGDVVLLDLWAGPGQGSVFADQTWMGFAGRSPDADVRRVWQAVKGARDAAVRFLRERWRPDGAVTGAQVDDVARAVIRDAGLADYFVHRTGHSIDRDLHGSGPHIDNFETEDARALVPGVGFSIEPGVYLPGRFGMRSEINVYIDTQSPEVNPSHPQDELILV